MQGHSPPGIRLDARGLACRRGERVLFRALDLSLGEGGAALVVGPNGVGKSSLLRILAGLLRPDAGTIARRGAIAFQDERLALDADLPLQAALGFWARCDRSLPVDAALSEVSLNGLEDLPVRYLSTGQRKRAAMARVLLQGADIWLLDEPLNGLDTQGAALMTALIARHRAAGGIAVVATHQAIDLPGAITIDLAP